MGYVTGLLNGPAFWEWLGESAPQRAKQDPVQGLEPFQTVRRTLGHRPEITDPTTRLDRHN